MIHRFSSVVGILLVLGLGMRPVCARAANVLSDLEPGKAQDIRPQDVITWEGFQAQVKGDSVEASLRMSATKDWKIYVKNLRFSAPSGWTIGTISAPPTQTILDPIENKETEVYAGGEFTVQMTGPGPWTAATVPVTITYVGCTNVICLFPYSQTIDVTVVQPLPQPTAVQGSAPAETPKAAAEGDLESRLAGQLRSGELSFVMLLLLVFVGGLLSNLTPCVAPLVPITLRLLARQGERHYLNAAFYAAGIVISYSALGLIAALSGGLFGSLLASTAFNTIFALIMAALGFTMLGFGDFSKLQTLGTKLGSGKPSLHNTLYMGLGAGLVAAPCTGPILAALLAYTARNNSGVAASTTLLGTYSLGFALPYVVLGGAAGKISKWKVSAPVQLGVKLLFASTMFGLAFYYLRVPFFNRVHLILQHNGGLVADSNLAQTFEPYWRPLALGFTGVGLAASLLFLIIPRLQHARAGMILPTLVLGFGLFTSWQWFTTTPAQASEKLTWFHDEAAAYAAAKSSGKPLFIDMWAEWCEACKKMDVSTLVDPEVRSAMRDKWVLLKLDFSDSTPTTDGWQSKYEIQSLPTFVLVPPDGTLSRKHAVLGYVNAATLLAEMHHLTQ